MPSGDEPHSEPLCDDAWLFSDCAKEYSKVKMGLPSAASSAAPPPPPSGLAAPAYSSREEQRLQQQLRQNEEDFAATAASVEAMLRCEEKALPPPPPAPANLSTWQDKRAPRAARQQAAPQAQSSAGHGGAVNVFQLMQERKQQQRSGGSQECDGLSDTARLLRRIKDDEDSKAVQEANRVMEKQWEVIRAAPSKARAKPAARSAHPQASLWSVVQQGARRRLSQPAWRAVCSFLDMASLVAMSGVSRALRCHATSEGHWKALCAASGITAPTEHSWRGTLLAVLKPYREAKKQQQHPPAEKPPESLSIGEGLKRVASSYCEAALLARGASSSSCVPGASAAADALRPMPAYEAEYLGHSMDALRVEVAQEGQRCHAAADGFWERNGFGAGAAPDGGVFLGELHDARCEMQALRAALRATDSRRSRRHSFATFEQKVASTYCSAKPSISFFDLELLTVTRPDTPEVRKWAMFKRDFPVVTYYDLKDAVCGPQDGGVASATSVSLGDKPAARVLECMSWFMGSGVVDAIRRAL